MDITPQTRTHLVVLIRGDTVVEDAPIRAETESELAETTLRFTHEETASYATIEEVFRIAPVNGAVVPSLTDQTGTGDVSTGGRGGSSSVRGGERLRRGRIEEARCWHPATFSCASTKHIQPLARWAPTVQPQWVAYQKSKNLIHLKSKIKSYDSTWRINRNLMGFIKLQLRIRVFGCNIPKTPMGLVTTVRSNESMQ